MTTLPLRHSVARQMDTAMQDDNEVSAELADDFWASPDIVTTDLTPSRLENFRGGLARQRRLPHAQGGLRRL